MAITLTAKYLAELKKAPNTPHVVIELALDSGVVRFGQYGRNGGAITNFLADGTYMADGSVYAGGDDDLAPYNVKPVLKSVSSLQNKIDPKAAYSTRGTLTFVIAGRENFQSLISGNYLKNRRVTRMDGFISPGFTYSDYAATFTGKVSDWSRKGDELTITVSDDLVDAARKLPVENAAKTQYLDYRNMSPVDVMTNILLTQLGVAASLVDSAKFASERDNWLNGWKYDRVITEPKSADEYLSELQAETNSFIIHDGEKISYRVFAPPLPSETIEEWTDANNILSGSFSQKSGYKDNFYNRVVLYYDYDESGPDNTDNYLSAVIAVDAGSQDATHWNEVRTKVIRSKWMRSFTYSQPVNVTGAVIYHLSRNCGAGQGILFFTYDAVNGSTLKWQSPTGGVGAAVKVTADGKYQLFDADATKWIRVIVTAASLPTANKTDYITVTALRGSDYATTIATKILNRYRDPSAAVTFDVDINNVAWNSQFIKPADMKDVTTDEACERGVSTWNKERVLLTSVRPDPATHRVRIEAVETGMYRRYGFIAPAGMPDYPGASAAQRGYGFVGAAVTNKVNAGAEDGYYCW